MQNCTDYSGRKGRFLKQGIEVLLTDFSAGITAVIGIFLDITAQLVLHQYQLNPGTMN